MTVTFSTNLPPSQSPFVTPSTGVLSNDGYQFLMNLLNQVAKAQATATVDSQVKATGATQATARPLTAQWNAVTSNAAGNGVLLQSLTPGQSQTVFNDTAGAINVYPPPGLAINAQAVNAPFVLAPGANATFKFVSSTQIIA